MSLFVLDNRGDNELLNSGSNSLQNIGNSRRSLIDAKLPTTIHEYLPEESECEESDTEEAETGDYYDLPPPNVDLSEIINSTLLLTERTITKEELELQRVSLLVDAAVANAESRPEYKRTSLRDLDFSDFNELTGKFDDEPMQRTDIDKEMATSTLVPGFAKLKQTPAPTPKELLKINKLKRAQTKGAAWFNMPATEVTEEVGNDLKILQMRSVLDPKRFYKKNDLKVLPKYFQVGTVQHSPLDFYNERDTRKNKKRSMVDELLADAEMQKYTKRKYNEIMVRKDKYAQRKAQKKMKKLKKNK